MGVDAVAVGLDCAAGVLALKRHQVQELVSDDVNDLAIERRPAGGAGVLASLVALVAQDVARGALQNQVNQFFANKNNKGNPLQT